MTDEENKMESGHDDIMPPTGSSGSGNTKWIAIIIVLVVVIAGLAVAYAIKPSGTVSSSSSGSYVPTGVVSATSGTSFNFIIGAGNLQTLNASFGDRSTSGVNFATDPNGATLSHNYTNTGTYLLYFTGSRTNGTSLGNNLLPINGSVSTPLSGSQSAGFAQIIQNYSSNYTSNLQIFQGDHANVGIVIGFYTEPSSVIFFLLYRVSGNNKIILYILYLFLLSRRRALHAAHN